MRLTQQQREQTERRIRAAMDRLLNGHIPESGGLDVKTLAAEAGISRAALYRTFGHLKDEFQRRRETVLLEAGHPDPREQRINRLRERNTRLTRKLAQSHADFRTLSATHQRALSALSAADDTIQRLERALARQAVEETPESETRRPELVLLDDYRNRRENPPNE